MSTMGGFIDRVGGATTTLLCGEPLGSDGREGCIEHLAGGDGDVLFVTYGGFPTGRVESLPDGASVRCVLAVGDGPHREAPLDDVPVEVVSTPGDVTALGIRLSRALSATDGDLAVCFDSVTAMCQYVERETAYNLLHTLDAQLYAADARAHFHLDPAAHDPATVDLFTSLCDAAVDLRGEDPVVRTRPAVE